MDWFGSTQSLGELLPAGVCQGQSQPPRNKQWLGLTLLPPHGEFPSSRRKATVQVGKYLIDTPGPCCPSFNGAHAPTDLLLPRGLGLRREILIVFGKIKQHACQHPALNWRQFQRFPGDVRKYFHARNMSVTRIFASKGKHNNSSMHSRIGRVLSPAPTARLRKGWP